jgi:rhodanese-related sulfurtransferase
MTIKTIAAADIARLMSQDAITLIDVREADEYAAERIKGSQLFPLSKFDPSTLPVTAERPIVFHCLAGGRSAKAVAACNAAGIPVEGHMQGGIQAWKSAGLPVEKGKA